MAESKYFSVENVVKFLVWLVATAAVVTLAYADVQNTAQMQAVSIKANTDNINKLVQLTQPNTNNSYKPF